MVPNELIPIKDNIGDTALPLNVIAKRNLRWR